MTSDRHYPALDGLRGLAVVLVMLSHFLSAGDLLDDTTPLGGLLLGGFVGVDLFFVLSGFLITGILLDAPASGWRFFLNFYARRGLRIFPLYYAALAIAFGLRPMPGDSPAWYWLFASNLGATLYERWLSSPIGLNLSHFWSVAVEEQFYLVWPFLVRGLSVRTLQKVCVACLLLAPAIHFALHFTGHPIAAYLFTPVRLNTLAGGAWLAIAFRNPLAWQKVTHHAPWIAAVTGTISLIGLMFPQYLSLVPFAPLLWGSLLALALRAGSLWQSLLARPLPVLFGKFSFGLYVWHYLADPWLKGPVWHSIHEFAANSPLALMLFVAVAFALTFAAALISWFSIEKPCLALKRHVRYDHRPLGDFVVSPPTS